MMASPGAHDGKLSALKLCRWNKGQPQLNAHPRGNSSQGCTSFSQSTQNGPPPSPWKCRFLEVSQWLASGGSHVLRSLWTVRERLGFGDSPPGRGSELRVCGHILGIRPPKLWRSLSFESVSNGASGQGILLSKVPDG